MNQETCTVFWEKVEQTKSKKGQEPKQRRGYCKLAVVTANVQTLRDQGTKWTRGAKREWVDTQFHEHAFDMIGV